MQHRLAVFIIPALHQDREHAEAALAIISRSNHNCPSLLRSKCKDFEFAGAVGQDNGLAIVREINIFPALKDGDFPSNGSGIELLPFESS
ncbi:hypothetical protein [Leisingera caerulea]|uniref:hypothetical protein n=1 Tax=Leisingera caerulea TaxID=506591 RepID=UPI000411A194|nr:hypothetical protein [Leisingera caerulea]